jgi:UDP:flavonoid glycosyltransferase YjiC (YdhE family)
MRKGVGDTVKRVVSEPEYARRAGEMAQKIKDSDGSRVLTNTMLDLLSIR